MAAGLFLWFAGYQTYESFHKPDPNRIRLIQAELQDREVLEGDGFKPIESVVEKISSNGFPPEHIEIGPQKLKGRLVSSEGYFLQGDYDLTYVFDEAKSFDRVRIQLKVRGRQLEWGNVEFRTRFFAGYTLSAGPK